MDRRAVVLVEGESDRNAVLTLAGRLGRDLAAEGIEVRAMGGATNVDRHLAELAGWPDVEVCGLYDEAEERFFARALERHGFGADPDRARLRGLGFHCCVEDLEDELIRVLGVERVLAIVGAEGEERAWERFRQMPHQRDRAPHEQLRRFLGTKSGRKIRYGGLLAGALDLDRLPAPLRALMRDLRPW